MLDNKNFKRLETFLVKLKYFKKLTDGCHFKLKSECGKFLKRNNSDRSLKITVGPLHSQSTLDMLGDFSHFCDFLHYKPLLQSM